MNIFKYSVLHRTPGIPVEPPNHAIGGSNEVPGNICDAIVCPKTRRMIYNTLLEIQSEKGQHCFECLPYAKSKNQHWIVRSCKIS